jgi:hypothetical protein
MQSPVSRNIIKLDKMRSSTQMSNDPDEVAPSSPWVSSVRYHFDQFRNKYPRVPGFGRRHHKTGLLEAARSTPGEAHRRKTSRSCSRQPSHSQFNRIPTSEPVAVGSRVRRPEGEGLFVSGRVRDAPVKRAFAVEYVCLRFNVVICVVGNIVPSLGSANTT